jgi:NAD(P)-dependent dehydrogenase (short-subunit alcohol dehydrogenase family)
MDLQLKGKVALITGGSRGIGKATARALALEGADVSICSRNEAEIKASAEELSKATGRKVVGFVADTSKAEDIKRLVDETVKAFGHLDILVNNASRVGGTQPDAFDSVTEELLYSDFETKVLGYTRLAREAAPYMLKNGWGRIVNVSGMAARTGGGISGGMRNAAVANLTKSLSDALAPKGINVNCVHPAGVNTDTMQTQMEARAKARNTTVAELQAQMGQGNAIKRMVTGEEIATVIAFLCSPVAVSVTGESISVAGGSNKNVSY